MKAAYDLPLRVEIFDGEVVLTSTQGATAVALTPEAAAQTGRRIQAALLELERARPGGDDPPPVGD
jgi:hypothetical protein